MLRRLAKANRIPHALLFSGQQGVGKLAIAIAFGRYLLCENKQEDDACNQCPACRQSLKWSHPDLHFSFPIVKKNTVQVCADYLKEWYGLLGSSLYFGLDDWLDAMGAPDKNALIPEAECDSIIDQMSISSYEGGYKVMIVWLPERMNASAANNLLKTLEEPSRNTVFILVSNDTSTILPTIMSRVQEIVFRPLPTDVIADALVRRNAVDEGMARQLARISGGSYLKALQLINVNSDSVAFFEQFAQLMRKAYGRDLPALKEWAEDVTAWGKEKQKAFLDYCQNMIRENFMYNFHRPELNFMNDQEAQFAVRFARFINERNVKGFMEEFSRAQKEINHNINSRTMFFAMALQCILLIKK